MTAPLPDRLAEAIQPELGCENHPADYGWCAICGETAERIRDALLPLIEAEKAETWDEAYQAGADDMHDRMLGLSTGRPNPYKEDK